MTTTPDFRALGAKIVELWDADCDIDVEINELRELLATPPPEPPTVPWADVQVATEKAFQFWWDNEGSGMPPKHDEEISAYAERISKLAWSNGAYVACARLGL